MKDKNLSIERDNLDLYYQEGWPATITVGWFVGKAFVGVKKNVYEFPEIVTANVVGPKVEESQPETFAWFKTAVISIGVVAFITILFE